MKIPLYDHAPLHHHIISIHRKFYQNWLIYDFARKNLATVALLDLDLLSHT